MIESVVENFANQNACDLLPGDLLPATNNQCWGSALHSVDTFVNATNKL
jgi:hypothetical protein